MFVCSLLAVWLVAAWAVLQLQRTGDSTCGAWPLAAGASLSGCGTRPLPAGTSLAAQLEFRVPSSSSCGAWVSGSQALQHRFRACVASSPVRARSRVSCLGRQILHH